MKQAFTYLLFLIAFALLTAPVRAQNTKDLYYIIRKKAIDNGQLRIVYRDPSDSIKPIRMCYSELKAEGLYIEDGVPVFHFRKIPSTQYDTVAGCISNNTPLGRFEIDVRKRRIGEPHRWARIPFRAINWNASLTLYKVRFAQSSHPVYAVSDPASMLVSVVYGYTFGSTKINHESITHYYATLGPFVGITSASINSDTVTDPLLLSSEQSNVAFAYGVCAVLGRNNFGFSISLGFDVSIGKNSSLWIYQNKPWLGIGVSTSLGMF